MNRPPLLRGGQGRDEIELEESAFVVLVIALAFAVLLLALLA